MTHDATLLAAGIFEASVRLGLKPPVYKALSVQDTLYLLKEIEALAQTSLPPATGDLGLSANDLYHVMQAWEKEPASEAQTRIVVALGALRDFRVRRGDTAQVSPLVAESA